MAPYLAIPVRQRYGNVIQRLVPAAGRRVRRCATHGRRCVAGRREELIVANNKTMRRSNRDLSTSAQCTATPYLVHGRQRAGRRRAVRRAIRRGHIATRKVWRRDGPVGAKGAHSRHPEHTTPPTTASRQVRELWVSHCTNQVQAAGRCQHLAAAPVVVAAAVLAVRGAQVPVGPAASRLCHKGAASASAPTERCPGTRRRRYVVLDSNKQPGRRSGARIGTSRSGSSQIASHDNYSDTDTDTEELQCEGPREAGRLTSLDWILPKMRSIDDVDDVSLHCPVTVMSSISRPPTSFGMRYSPVSSRKAHVSSDM